MASHLIYDSIAECLDSLDISYKIKEEGDHFRVEVFTPMFIPKLIKLPISYSRTIPIHDVHKDVQNILAKKFGIIKKSGYTIVR